MSSADTGPTVVIEAPMGTGTYTIDLDGKVKYIPFSNGGIDWKAFEKAIEKINKLKENK